MRCEVCGYQFLLASSTKCPDCGDLREAIVKESDIQAAMGHANLDANALTNHSVIGKRPFDQVATFPVTEEMLERGRYAGDPYLSDEELACKYRAMAAVAPTGRERLRVADRNVRIAELETANAHLTRQLAAQALAHTEQMEGLKTSRDTTIAGLQRAVVFGEKLQGDYQELERFSRARIVTNQSSCDEYDEMLAAKDARIAELNDEAAQADALITQIRAHNHNLMRQLAMRITPATQPTDVQQTPGDAKAMQEPKAFPAGALKAGGSDPTRMGP